jgi:MFS transporter, UMF1 family
MNRKNLFYWSLYDFANSFVLINFLLYFSQWLVIDGGLSDFWYNALFAISSILLLLSAPTLAAFTDRHGGRKYFLKLATFGTLIGYSLATIFAYWDQSIFLIALCFLLGQYFYQLSFSFHNPLIEDVADISHRARASGIGQFANSLGQVMGLVLAIPLSQTRLQPLFPSIIVFFVLSLPMLYYFKEQKIKQVALTIKEFKDDSKKFYKRFMLFFSVSVAIPILVSFFFFNDALITVSNNYSIYLERVFGIPDGTKNIILLVVLVMSAIGGLVFGKVADKIGTLKALKYILASWIILLPTLGIVKSIVPLIICSALLGFFMGGIWTVTRAYLSQTLKKEELGYGFSFYTIFERFATFLGPLSWGLIIAVMGTGENSYRTAMISMTVYIVLGLVVISYWKRNSDVKNGAI